MRHLERKILGMLLAGILVNAPFSDARAEALRLDLDECIEMALDSHRSIEQAEQDLARSQDVLSEARRSTGPRLAWSATGTRIGGRRYRNAEYRNDVRNSLSAGLPLYTGGKLEGQIKAAEYGVKSSDLMVEDTKQSVHKLATEAFYQALYYEAVVGVREEAVSLLKQNLEMVKAQYENGAIAWGDVLTSQVQLSNQLMDLEQARGDWQKGIASLAKIVGLPVDTEIDVDGEMLYRHYDKSLQECMTAALANRADGFAAEYAVKQGEAQVDVARSGYRPTLDLSASSDRSGSSLFKDNHTANGWNMTLTAQWNIFDNNLTSAQVREAKDAVAKAESMANEKWEEIQLEVMNAYTDLCTAEREISVTGDLLKQAEEDYTIAQARYINGVDTIWSVMQAQEKLTESQLNYQSAIFMYEISKESVRRAMGVSVDLDAARYAELERTTHYKPRRLHDESLLEGHASYYKEKDAIRPVVTPDGIDAETPAMRKSAAKQAKDKPADAATKPAVAEPVPEASEAVASELAGNTETKGS